MIDANGTNLISVDHSRVKLRPSDDMDGSDYINANYIPVTIVISSWMIIMQLVPQLRARGS